MKDLLWPFLEKILGKKKNEGIMKKVDVENISIIDLCAPLFQVVPTPFYLEEDSPLKHIWDMRMNIDFDYQNPSPKYKAVLEKLIKKYSHEEKLYYWLAEPYIERGQYKKAMDIIKDGFSKVDNRCLLANTMGNIYLLQSNPIAIGWYMQSCLLATIQFLTYKYCAVVAKEIGNENLYWRLRNAGDVIDTKFSPDNEEKIRILTHLANKGELTRALKIFETNMDEFLPKAEDIPKDGES